MRNFGIWIVVAWLVPVSALAQSVSPAPVGRLWIVAGGASSTLRGHCQDCGLEYPFRHGGAFVANVGYRVTPKMDVGADLFWMQWHNDSGRIRATAVEGVAQFRPWQSKGFFLKGGAGMGFVRNWVYDVSPDPDNSKALAVVIGGGWVFNPEGRLGLQLFATQHVGALGDLQTTAGTVPNVTANFWSVGAAIVIR
jgi:hypothetical protein